MSNEEATCDCHEQRADFGSNLSRSCVLRGPDS